MLPHCADDQPAFGHQHEPLSGCVLGKILQAALTACCLTGQGDRGGAHTNSRGSSHIQMIVHLHQSIMNVIADSRNDSAPVLEVGDQSGVQHQCMLCCNQDPPCTYKYPSDIKCLAATL